MRVLLLAVLATALAAADPLVPDAAGEVRLADLREHERGSVVIRVANPYDRAVKIERAYSNCACFKPTLDRQFLLPYQEALLTVTLDNRFFSGAQRHGVWIEFTDGRLDSLQVVLRWTVIPDVAVDVLPAAGPFDRRPEQKNLRDVYAYTVHERPDELVRLRKYVLLTSPENNRPDGGLKVEAVEYGGTLWEWIVKPVDAGTVLLVAKARDGATVTGPVKLEEKVVVRTNHPHKPVLNLQLLTALDDSDTDPWANRR